MKQRNKESFVKRFKIWMISCNKYESVLLSFLPVITLIILTSIFISSVFHSSISALIWCLWTMIITMQYLLSLWTVTNALIFVVFLLIYVAYHVMFYYMMETPALYMKPIMTVWLISVQLQINVGHILNMIIRSGWVTLLLMQYCSYMLHILSFFICKA